MHACFALKSTVNGWNRLVMVTEDSLEVCASISEALGTPKEKQGFNVAYLQYLADWYTVHRCAWK